MTTAARIKARRLQLGMTGESLAQKIGVSKTTIYRYENGDIEKIPLNSLEPIANALNTTVAYLMGWDDKKTPIPENEDGRINLDELDDMTAESIQLLLALPEEKQQDAGSYIRFLAKNEDK